MTGRSITLQWESPISNGGSELTGTSFLLPSIKIELNFLNSETRSHKGYIVEKGSAKSSKWTKIVTLDTNCLQYCVDNLKEKSEYTFRVLAENAVGLSAPAVTGSISLKTHASK